MPYDLRCMDCGAKMDPFGHCTNCDSCCSPALSSNKNDAEVDKMRADKEHLKPGMIVYRPNPYDGAVDELLVAVDPFCTAGYALCVVERARRQNIDYLQLPLFTSYAEAHVCGLHMHKASLGRQMYDNECEREALKKSLAEVEAEIALVEKEAKDSKEAL